MSTAKAVAGVIIVALALVVLTLAYQKNRLRDAEAALIARLAEAVQRAQRAEKRVEEVEKDNGDLLRAAQVLRTHEATQTAYNHAAQVSKNPYSDQEPHPSEPAFRQDYQQVFAQDQANRRAAEAKFQTGLRAELSQLDPVHKFNRLVQVAKQYEAKGNFSAAIVTLEQALAGMSDDVPMSDVDSATQMKAADIEETQLTNVTIQSDGNTFVSIAGYRTLGMIGSFNTIQIPSGDYEIVGLRHGYQDVVIPLQVRYGVQPPVVTIASTAPARQ